MQFLPMFEKVWEKLFEVFKVLIVLLLFSLFSQKILNFIILWIIRLRSTSIKYLSFGFIFGTTVHRIRITTNRFDLRIEKFHFKIDWKPSINFHGIDLLILDNENDGSNTKNNQSNNNRNSHFDVINETFNFSLDRTYLFLIRSLISLNTFIRSGRIRLLNDSSFSFNLCTLKIAHKSENRFVLESFLHGLTDLKTEETINYIRYCLSFRMLEKPIENTRFTKLAISEWHSTCNIGDAHINIDEHLTKGKSESELKQTTLKYDEMKQLLHKKIRKVVKSLKYPLRSLKILDIKIENLRITYKKLASINISSIQLYIEAVNVANYDTALDKLPPNKHTWGDYEISISANLLLFKVGQSSTFRIPLVNMIITTNIILCFAEDFPFNQTSIYFSTNIINPSIFSTITDVTKALTLLNAQRVKSLGSNTKIQETKDQEDILSYFSRDLPNLPNFIFELKLSNFTSTFQISENENIIMKVINIQSLLGRNRTTDLKVKKLTSTARNSWSNGFRTKSSSSNLINIVGADFSYLKLSNESSDLALSVPICSFERIDSFLDEFSRTKMSIQLTLRNAYLTFDDLIVLERLHSSCSTLVDIFSNSNQSYLEKHSSVQSSFLSKDGLEISLNLRMKNITFSTVIASYIPKILDPSASEKFNLTDIDRGFRVLIQETILILDNSTRTLKVRDASIYRIMDNITGEAIVSTAVRLTDLKVSVNQLGQVIFTLPIIRFRLDVNIIWLAFYLMNLYDRYFSRFNKTNPSSLRPCNSVKHRNKERLIRFLDMITINISKVVIEIILPEQVPLIFVLKQLSYSGDDNNLIISQLSLLVKSVYMNDAPVYFILMDIKDLITNIRGDIENKTIGLKTSSIYLHTEYHFKLYMVIDNIITAYKSFKQIREAFSDLSRFHRLYPVIQLPKEIPNIRLISEHVSVNVEEDPFEQELGLILKVGILEQRERLEKLKFLEKDLQSLNDTDISSQDINQTERDIYISGIGSKARRKLNENFSASWISRIRKAKLSFHGMPYSIEESEDLDFRYKFFSRQETSTVASLIIEDLDSKLHTPSFPVDDFQEFLFKYGKGVPKSKNYTLLILTGIDFKTGLWELKLRDYPIPVLSLPDTHTTGDIVFAEKMPEKGRGLHSIYVPFVPFSLNSQYVSQNSIYGSNIVRTMNSVKTYFNIKTSVTSGSPTHITWGKSLQPGFESFMLWFDYLTKPRLDPSAKLGFWDKFRYLFHGKWTYKFSEQSDININIKGAHDPYKIVDDGAGLTFCWSGGTVLNIHETSNPKEFLKFESKSFKLAVRDFTVADKFEKVFMQLDGEVVWKLGLLFEEGDFINPGDTPRLPPSVAHYDIQLVNPKEMEGVADYDSYQGFRSNFIHMAFGVYSSAKASSNNIYLGPISINHFLVWWKLFNTYTSGPIRQGPLFSDLVQNKTKFSRSLFTFKYQLHLEPLTISHVYNHFTPQYLPEVNEKSIFTGLKARLDSLKIDLHQKRIKLTHRNEKLNRSKPIWKFRIFTGEIDCTEVDLRVLSVVFDKSAVSEVPSKNEESDRTINQDTFKQSDWYNFQDYLDLDQISMTSYIPVKFDAIPLLNSPKISYFRKLNDNGYPVNFPFGNEESHDCLIGKNHPEKAQETLAKQRKQEIEEQIRSVQLSLNNISSSSRKSTKNDETVTLLTKELRELEHRLHIIHNVLNDLRLSDIVAESFSNDSSESSLDSSATTDSNSTKEEVNASTIGLLRTNKIESFISMRRASTVEIQSTYDNRFMVHNIQLKVDKTKRDLLLEYASNVFERKTINYAMTYSSVKIFKELLGNVLTNVKIRMEDLALFDEDDNVSNKEFILRFDELVKAVPDNRFNATDRYLFRLISPQIQVTSDTEPNTAILVSARDIEVGIIDISQIMRKSGKMIAMDWNTKVETRYCAIAKDLQLITLHKETLLTSETRFFHKNGYGMDSWSDFWPPWIPLETCYDGSLLEKHVFLKRRSMFLTFSQPNALYFGDDDVLTLSKDSKFRIGFPGLVITSNSEQYCTVYNMIEDLLSFSSEYDEKVERLSKVLLAEEMRNNLDKLDVSVITDLQARIKELYYTRAFLKQHKPKLYVKVSDDIKRESQITALKLTILMTAIKKNYNAICGISSSTGQKLTWRIGTDELIWKLFDDKNKPFITIGLSPSTYSRTETSNGVNSNKISISALNCFNQQDKPIFSLLLAPFKDHSLYDESIPMIDIFWIQGAAIGGISTIEELIVTLQPIIFKMDNNTADSIMNFLFPKTDTADSNFDTPNDKVHTTVGSFTTSPRSSSSYSNLPTMNSFGKELVLRDSSSINNSTRSYSSNNTRGLDSPKTSTSSLFKPIDYGIDEMLKRSGTYFNVKFIKIRKTVMSVSYKGRHHLLTDVNKLSVKVPDLIYRNKLWSRDELFASLKHDIVKVVVKNMGSIIGNKFILHKRENRSQVSSTIDKLLDTEEKTSNLTPVNFTEANRSNYSVSLSQNPSHSHSRSISFKKTNTDSSHLSTKDDNNDDSDENIKSFFPVEDNKQESLLFE